MKYTIVYTGQFKRSLKKCAKRGLNIKTFTDALDLLQETGTLPPQYKAHRLVGKFNGCWECHLEPDWLMIWRQNNDILELILVDTGTHSDLF